MLKRISGGLIRLAGSYRAWAAAIGIAVTIAVYKGMPVDKANDIAQKVLIIIGALIAGDTLNPHQDADPTSQKEGEPE